MMPLDWFAIGFAAVALLNLAMIPKKGTRAGALALVGSLCAAGTYLWDRTDSALPKWLLAAAMGVLLASGLYESARAKVKRK
jgi:hypothetical protein